jgi:hypothetical protein
VATPLHKLREFACETGRTKSPKIKFKKILNNIKTNIINNIKNKKSYIYKKFKTKGNNIKNLSSYLLATKGRRVLKVKGYTPAGGKFC